MFSGIIKVVLSKVKGAFGLMNKGVGIIHSFWLFSDSCNGLGGKKKIAYICFNALAILAAVVSLGVCSLHFAFGEAYSPKIFDGYFANPLILLLNILPVFILFVFLYAVIGRSWIAYLIDSVIVMGFSLANFFKLKFRDDPVMFMDLLNVREAAAISEEGYNYEITSKMLVCCLVCVAFVVVLALFQSYKPDPTKRICIFAISIIVLLPLRTVYFNHEIYDKKTNNSEHIVRWSPTQVYISKGFVYPFLNSMQEFFGNEPEGYYKSGAELVLSGYSETDIPQAKKIDVIGVMLEAYTDVRTLGITDISPSVYSLYDNLKKDNYSGTLVTNIFAAGTIDSERAFLTGYPEITNYRGDINSYVRYFKKQGYITDGSHPSEEWFYNRKNVNDYLGFETYRFAESHFEKKYGINMRLDAVVFNDFYDSYKKITSSNPSKPYFGFHVTYQGHGPYDVDIRNWGTDQVPLYYNEDVSEQTNIILNNYLGSIKDTSWRLSMFVSKIKAEERPVVLVLFGDHKPWLGDGNSVYKELGINLDVSTADGFINYYSTEYIIIANDAAKAILGNEFKGNGPITSPCFLMNEVFDLCGFDGPRYMQYTDSVRASLPALNNMAAIGNDGTFYTNYVMPDDFKRIINEYKRIAYYESTNLRQ